jgi:hypothetical protein
MSRTILRLALALIATVVWAEDRVELNVTAAMREYCHIVRFPQGWTLPPADLLNRYNYNGEYEFRVQGESSSRFLIGGFVGNTYARSFTTNRYDVNLSDPKAPVLPASDAAWEASTPVSIVRDVTFPPAVRASQMSKLDGFQHLKSGEILAGGSLSPDRTWLVLSSWSGRADSSESPVSFACFPFGCRGKMFFDVFNMDTAKKLLTIVGSYLSPSPDSLLPTGPGWVTERYFVIPLGEHREQCLVCEFGRGRGTKP